MEAGKKSCPYCAEVIMTEAVLCKHCKSDVTQKIRFSPGAPLSLEKRMGPVSKVLVGIVIAITLYLAFGFHVSNTSQDKERMQAQDAVELCRQEANSYSGATAGKIVIADVCREVEDQLRKNFGPRAIGKAD